MSTPAVPSSSRSSATPGSTPGPAVPAGPPAVPLTCDLLRTYKPAKLFREHAEEGKAFTSIAFDDRGDYLITAGEDESLQLFNCKTGKHSKTLLSKKYGVDLAQFTHKSTTVIYASRKEDDTIRYHSLHDNKYLQYFRGHKKQVVSLEMSPVDDTFLSGSLDDTVRLWDLRTPNCQGLLNIIGHSLVAYDPNGQVFAVALNARNVILLYDVKNYDKDPFHNMSIKDPLLETISYPPRIPFMTSMHFSPNGLLLLVGTASRFHYVLDAFSGQTLHRLDGHKTLGTEQGAQGLSRGELSWTPDSKYIVTGSADGRIYYYDILNAARPRAAEEHREEEPATTILPAVDLDGHAAPSRLVAFNPRTTMFASTAGGELAFWLPEKPKKEDDED